MSTSRVNLAKMSATMYVFNLLFFLAWHGGSFCNAANAFRSMRAPVDTIRDYEIHVPVVTVPSSDQQEHPQQLQVSLSHFKLSLELNSGLIHPRFSSHHFDESGSEVIEKGHVNCFYQGSVEGHNDWQVTMSTCQGLQGSFGKYGSDDFYHVEPLDQTNRMLDQAHALYLDVQYSQRNGTCGTGTHKHIPVPEADFEQKYEGMVLNQHKMYRRRVNGFYIVEWAIINDNAQYVDFGSNLSAVVMRSLEIANYVDTTYRTLDIRVVVVDVITWTMGNPFTYPADSNADDILNGLTEYVPQLAVQRDSLMLMTGVNLLGSTIGLAFVGTMCSLRNSVGLTQDGRGSMVGVASTASHELGHIFNMRHDDGRACTCTDPVGRCIMAAVSVSGSFSTQWSSCSRSDLSTGFSTRNLNRCLNNEPQKTVGDPSCGNGIRENNEVCDCGSVEECTDPCCNATTCTLRQGAQCSEGLCCSDQCQFLSYGMTCREAAQECDIMEYCSGSSSDCPRDVYRQDGTPCNQSLEFCFTGVCQSLDAQCQRFFQTENAVSECYSQLNTEGTRTGNCGAAAGQYVACDTEHVQCGQLMCNGGSFRRSETPGLSALTNRRIITINSTVRATCSSFTLAPSADTISPGLVPDGTRCGNASVCVAQACVELSSLQYISACPTGNNGQTCSGDGICNNLNECSCNVGFSSSNCDSSTSSSSRTGVIVGAVLGTIFGLIVAAVVIAIIIFIVIKYSSKKKKSVPLTARSRPTSTKLGKSLTSSQDNLLDESNHHDKVSVRVVKPSRGYQPPPMRGSPPRTPETQARSTPTKPTASPSSSSKAAPVVSRYVPNSSNAKPKPPAHYRPGPPLPPSKAMPPPPSKHVAPPPSRGMPPPPSKAMPPPPPSHKSSNVPSAPARPGVSPPYPKGGSSAAPRGAPATSHQGRAPPPKPPQNTTKLSNVQKQWPPSTSGSSNGSPSTAKKPVPSSKKPLAPPRR